MALPENFSRPPAEEPRREFRNIVREFKKVVQSSQDKRDLQNAMENFIDAAKQMDWHQKNSPVHQKEIGEKATVKVWTEFDRYFKNLSSHKLPEKAVPKQDLLNALDEIEILIDSYKVY